MKLTARQEAFLQKLIALYQNDATPVHYTALAKQLDVNRYTAYDMLKVLEKKGYVASHYRAKEGPAGPGRSEVVFAPTKKADRLLQQVDTFLEDIDLAKAGPLAVFVSAPADIKWAMELLNGAIPDETAQIRYCAELIMVLLLSIRQQINGRSPLQASLLQLFPSANLSQRSHLTLLGGFLLGLLANRPTPLRTDLVEHTLRYQAFVFSLSDAECARLSQHLNDILVHYQMYAQTIRSKRPLPCVNCDNDHQANSVARPKPDFGQKIQTA